MRFVLVDKIDELEPGKRIKASKRLSRDDEIFRDHFPGFPIVPGVLLTEMMAQAAGKCLDAEGSHPGRPMLSKILSASFRAWVKPDEEAIIHARISQNRRTYATAGCFIEVDRKKVCTAELFFAFVPHNQFAPEYRDEVLAAYYKAQSR